MVSGATPSKSKHAKKPANAITWAAPLRGYACPISQRASVCGRVANIPAHPRRGRRLPNETNPATPLRPSREANPIQLTPLNLAGAATRQITRNPAKLRASSARLRPCAAARHMPCLRIPRLRMPRRHEKVSHIPARALLNGRWDTKSRKN